jgi:transcriptional regulator with XRE-family HTH domain
VGDHLRRARVLRGLLQAEVAAALGVSLGTIENWETNRTQVATRYLPKMVAFLGYDPRQEAGNLGDRIRVLRERQGLSQAALAEKLGVNTSTVVAWERGRVRKHFAKVRRRFDGFLGEDG